MDFPIDITELLRNRLAGDRRPPDGLLHPSGDLIGSLRHSQLRAAGAPTIESDLTSDVRLMTGTNWHTFMEETFRQKKLPVMSEVKLDKWLPEGWSGTADWIVWNDELKAFELGDLKTIKGEGIRFINQDGIKEEHMYQLSSYWYALENMGIPLVKRFHVYYLPMNASGSDLIEPSMQLGKPIDRSLIETLMKDRWEATKNYLEVVHDAHMDAKAFSMKPELLLNSFLAPVQERKLMLRYNKLANHFDLKLGPHWSAMYCPFPNELCDCSEQATEKVGHYYYDLSKDEVFYAPRKGYEAVQPLLKPNATQTRKLRDNG